MARIRIPADLPADPREAYRRGWTDRMSRNGKAGGEGRKAALSPERRSEIARAGALAKHKNAQNNIIKSGQDSA